jgi:adenylate cyclase class IV
MVPYLKFLIYGLIYGTHFLLTFCFPLQVDGTDFLLYAFQDKSAELIFYDRPNGDGPKLSKYDKCSVPDGSQMVSVLSCALGVEGSVSKKRHLFMVGQTRVHFDYVEDLGNFMELEVSTYCSECRILY